jgi:hypothetical protein
MVAPTQAWTGSARDAAVDALGSLASPGVLAALLLWALAAATLPWLLRRRSLRATVIGLVGWTAALWAGSQGAAGALAGTAARVEPRGALVGAAVGALAAGTACLARRRARWAGRALLP